MSIDQKLEDVKKKYTDPDDLEMISEWEKKMKVIAEKTKYLDLKETKEVVDYIKSRIKAIRIKLSSDVGMEKVDNISWHGRIEELTSFLAVLSKDSKKDLESIEVELDKALE